MLIFFMLSQPEGLYHKQTIGIQKPSPPNAPSSQHSHQHCILFDDQRGRPKRQPVDPVRQILVQQVAVLVLLDTRVEQRGAVLQAKASDPLLHKVKVFVPEVVLLLQRRHVIGLGDDYHQIDAQIGGERAVGQRQEVLVLDGRHAHCALHRRCRIEVVAGFAVVLPRGDEALA